MSFAARITHSLLRLSAAKDARFFHSRLNRVSETQWEILKNILRRNSSTDFGKQHRFDMIHSPSEFASRVPVREYEEFDPWIERVERGEKNVLTAEDILLMEPTGGSTRGSKLIPYTPSLKREFQRGINTWIADLYRGFPGLRKGSQYWSISPVFRK